jgi:cell division septal protein FtsQ
MSLRIRWPFISMGVLVLFAAGFAAMVIFSDYFRLRRVKIEPENYSEELAKLNLTTGLNIFKAPLEDAVTYLLKGQTVFRVEADYDLPDGIAIRVNHVKSIALALDDDGHTIYGLDNRCRIIPFEDSSGKFDLPLITGLKDCAPYGKPEEKRLGLILEQLDRLKIDHKDFYQIISSIDLSTEDSVGLYMDGIPFHIVLYAGGLYKGVEELKQFLTGFNPDLSQIKRLDLRSEGQIIALRKKCPKQG